VSIFLVQGFKYVIFEVLSIVLPGWNRTTGVLNAGQLQHLGCKTSVQTNLIFSQFKRFRQIPSKSFCHFMHYFKILKTIMQLQTLFTLRLINMQTLCRAQLVSGFNCLCGKFISIFNQPPKSTQHGHPSTGRHNEYRSMGSEALQLGSCLVAGKTT